VGITAATSASGVLETGISTVLTEISSSITASVLGFQTIMAASSAPLDSSALDSSVSAVFTSNPTQILETPTAFANATAVLTSLGGGEAVTATATALGAAGSGGLLEPLPGSAITTESLKPLSSVDGASTAALEPLNGAAGASTATDANAAEATGTGDSEGSTTSLKPLGGSETVTSLQALSSLKETGQATGTFSTAVQTGSNATAGSASASNALISSTSSSTVPPNDAACMSLSWALSGGLTGLVAYLLL
jgi:hypothetical protein